MSTHWNIYVGYNRISLSIAKWTIPCYPMLYFHFFFFADLLTQVPNSFEISLASILNADICQNSDIYRSIQFDWFPLLDTDQDQHEMIIRSISIPEYAWISTSIFFVWRIAKPGEISSISLVEHVKFLNWNMKIVPFPRSYKSKIAAGKTKRNETLAHTKYVIINDHQMSSSSSYLRYIYLHTYVCMHVHTFFV